MNPAIKQKIKTLLKTSLGTQNPFIYLEKKKREIEKLRYRQSYSTDQLIQFIEELGAEPGDTLFLPTSWNEFYNYTGKIPDLISSLMSFLGPAGNVAMPSNTGMYEDGDHFNVRTTPTNAGLIAEVFRRTKGVERSVHLNSSVCVLGRDAKMITEGHERSYTSWDEHSPHHKLYKMNAKIVALGCGKFFNMGTPWHCVDSHLRKELPYFDNIYQEKISYSWVDSDKNEGISQALVRSSIADRTDLKSLTKHLSDVPHKDGQLSNLLGYYVPIGPLVDKGIELAREGIVMYKYPKPRKELFNL